MRDAIQAAHDTVWAAYSCLKEMGVLIIDVTGIELTPGNHWKDCLGNGERKDVGCCCDECAYMMCCVSDDFPNICISCNDSICLRKNS